MTLTVDLFISILSFGMAAFAIGYALGQSSNKTQKQPPETPILSDYFC